MGRALTQKTACVIAGQQVCLKGKDWVIACALAQAVKCFDDDDDDVSLLLSLSWEACAASELQTVAADRFDEMNGDEDEGEDAEPKARAKPRPRKPKINADGEEKKPRAPGKPVRCVTAHVAEHLCSSSGYRTA